MESDTDVEKKWDAQMSDFGIFTCLWGMGHDIFFENRHLRRN